MFLDGSAMDSDGDPIVEWLWSLESGPSSNYLIILSPDERSPLISIVSSSYEDPSGDYVLSFIASDGSEWSEPDYVTVHVPMSGTPPPENLAPAVYAGSDLYLLLGDTSQLEGQGIDWDGDPITGWEWSVESSPAGSSPTIEWPDEPEPTFYADIAGDYVLSLRASDGIEWSEPDYVTMHVLMSGSPPPGENHAPVADAGPDQELERGEGMFLDGSATDPDSDPIVEWNWSVESGPAVENLLLEYSNEPSMLIFIQPYPNEDPSGDYVLSLIASDGSEWSEPDYVTIHVPGPVNPPPGNRAPAVSAGPDLELVLGDTTQLEGQGIDWDGDPITEWEWSVESSPFGSSPTIEWPDEPESTFYADIAGNYVLSLRASDGIEWSEPDYVTIHIITILPAGNRAPAVDAGPDQELFYRSMIRLDGRGVDADGDPIVEWLWSVESAPAGSSFPYLIQWPDERDPRFEPDIAGDYVLSLRASDGIEWSEPDYVTIHVQEPLYPPLGNSAPVVYAGPDQELFYRSMIRLDGRGVDADGDPIVEWLWSVESAPAGSSSPYLIQWPDERDPRFEPDIAGDYVLSLRASDGLDWSEPDYITIHVTEPSSPPPVVYAGPDQELMVGDITRLEGSATDPNNDPILYWRWDVMALLSPAGSSTIIEWPDEPEPYFSADMAGDYILRLSATDGCLSGGNFIWSQSDYFSWPREAAYVKIHVIDPNSPPDSPPVVDAGPDQELVGHYTRLEGSATDPDGDPIVGWQWTVESSPIGISSYIIQWPDERDPGFDSDIAGDYVLSLIATDGTYWSDSDYVFIHVPDRLYPMMGNRAPVVDAGSDQEMLVGDDIFLEGRSVDPDRDPIIELLWTVESSPAGSFPSIEWPDELEPTFSADMAGDYVLGLIAFDGLDWSEPDYVTIHITDSNQNIPEFPTIVLPVAVILGLALIFSKRE